jgi:hypothetical protein
VNITRAHYRVNELFPICAYELAGTCRDSALESEK